MVERCLALLDGHRGAAGRRRRHGQRRDRARHRRTSGPDARVIATDVSPTRSRWRARTPRRSGSTVELREASLLDGARRARSTSSSRTRRTCSRPSSTALRAGGARLGAAARARRPTARPRRSRATRAACSTAGSCSRCTRAAPRGRRARSTGLGYAEVGDLARPRRARAGGGGRDGSRRRSRARVDAIRRGAPVLLPTDTVYGLCASPSDEAAAARALRAEGPRRRRSRPRCSPPSVERAARVRPRAARPLRARSCSALLPGPYTLVLPNPARRYPWLTGRAPGHDRRARRRRCRRRRSACSTRSAACSRRARTSRAARRPRPSTDVPERIRAGCDAEIDAGRLPGISSTVLDFTGPRAGRAARGRRAGGRGDRARPRGARR